MRPFFKVLSDEALWAIHCASLDTLENVRVDVRDERAREALLRVGAAVDGSASIRIPAGVVKDALAKLAQSEGP